MVVPSSIALTTANKIALIFLSIGCTFCVIGYIKTPPMFDQILTDVIRKLLVLSPSSEIFETWADPDIPVYQRMFFFDIQNKDEIMRGEKPRVKEVGPYTYRVMMKPANITFDGNDTLSFRKHMAFYFEPDLSVGLEDDTITTVNFPFATAANGVRSENWFAKLAISAVANIHNQELFAPITIRDLLWGYQDPLLNQLQTLVGEAMISSDEFGLLLGKNNTIDKDVYTVNTGETDQMRLNTIEEFNGMESLPYWGDDTANMINGTDGTFFHPFVEENETLYVFNPFIFRSLPYTYLNDTSYEGIPLKQFTVPSYAYANPSEYPANAGFCTTEPCAPSGILDVSPCAQGVPLALSNPHFLHASEDILQSMDGINGSEELHGSRMAIEPLMGMPYVFDQRVQINYYLESVDGIYQTQGPRPLYYPMVWLETHGQMPDVVVNKYKDNIGKSYGMIEWIQLSCIISGSVMGFIILSILALALLRCYWSQRDRKQNVANNNVPLKKAEKEKVKAEREKFIYQDYETKTKGQRKATNGVNGYKPVATKYMKEETV